MQGLEGQRGPAGGQQEAAPCWRQLAAGAGGAGGPQWAGVRGECLDSVEMEKPVGNLPLQLEQLNHLKKWLAATLPLEGHHTSPSLHGMPCSAVQPACTASP